MQVVHVDGLRDADEHAYRRMVKGLDAFEKCHALAPAASLRYRLYPRGNPARLTQTFYDFYPVLTDRTYMLRFADTSWPDDTLVELEYMDDATVAEASATQASQPSGTP